MEEGSMTELETLILTQAANNEATSADSAFAAYPAKTVADAMMRLSDAGWFDARMVRGAHGPVVTIGLVDLKTILRYSLAREH
jgi:hypothetical protein